MINTFIKNILSCNCRKKHEYHFDSKYRTENIVYNYVASVDGYPSKFYLGTAEGDFKQRFYNHRMSFNNEGCSRETRLSKYVSEIKEEVQENAITQMVHHQICISVLKHFQDMSVVSARKMTPIQTNCLIKDQILIQSTATLTTFYYQITNLMIRPYKKCPISIHNDITTVK